MGSGQARLFKANEGYCIQQRELGEWVGGEREDVSMQVGSFEKTSLRISGRGGLDPQAGNRAERKELGRQTWLTIRAGISPNLPTFPTQVPQLQGTWEPWECRRNSGGTS